MHSFYKSKSGILYKAYDQQDDWQIMGSNGIERWFSKWTDNVAGSLIRAFMAVSGDNITIDQIIVSADNYTIKD